MTTTNKAGLRRLAAIAGALAALVAVLLASLALAARPERETPAPRTSAACSGASADASETSTRELRGVVRCLINRARADADARRLVRDKALQRVAQRHSKVMVATDCLGHQCPDEADLEERVRRSGYLDGAEAWRFAENTGCGADAKSMVQSWLESDEHRANLLTGKFRELGVGVVDEPVGGACKNGYATFTVVLGWRRAGS